MEEITIESRDLTWRPDKKRDAVLNGVTLNFLPGGIYGIIGPNGSGKTSFLRHLLRFLRAESGSLILGEKDLSEYERVELAKKMAFVPQNTQIDTDFLVYDIVMMGRNPYLGRFSGIERIDREKVEDALLLASCTELRSRQFSKLSGGEAQRVLIARAIAQDTPWLLLDEPVSSLDIRHQIGIMQTLQELNQKAGKSVILVLHDLNLAVRFCSHLVLLKDGNVVAAGRTQEVLKAEMLQKVYEMEFVEVVHPVSKEIYYLPK